MCATAFFAARSFTDLDDLNAQAAAWCSGASPPTGRCPGEPERQRARGFAEEVDACCRCPTTPLPLLERVAVKVGKTPYVRFDLNDYSVPHTHVRRTAHRAGRPARGAHRRWRPRYSPPSRAATTRARRSRIPATSGPWSSDKRAARQHRAIDRLAQAAPASQSLLSVAAARGDNLGAITAALLRLLERYGAAELAGRHPRGAGARRAAPQRGAPRARAPSRAAQAPPRRRHRAARPRARRAMPRCSRTDSKPTTGSRIQPMNEPDAPARPRQGAASCMACWRTGPRSAPQTWVATLIDWEEQERARRSLERRLRDRPYRPLQAARPTSTGPGPSAATAPPSKR